MTGEELFQKLFNGNGFAIKTTILEDWESLWEDMRLGDSEPWLGGKLERVADDVMAWYHPAIRDAYEPGVHVQYLGYHADWEILSILPYSFLNDECSKIYGANWRKGARKVSPGKYHHATGLDMSDPKNCRFANPVGVD